MEQQNVKILKDHQLVKRVSTSDAKSYRAEWVFKLAPMVQLQPPEPIPDASNSLSNQRLKELAKQHQPPPSWYEGEEEQLF